MDLWQLHIFCRVIELKGFSKAASDIRLSQPTVSSHIKDLENHFNCRLIDRVGKKAIPTQAGQILYQQAKKLLKARDRIETSMAAFQGKLKGTLYLGGSTIPANFILPSLIGEFRQVYPDINISLSVGDTQTIIEAILSGTTEIGIVGAIVKERHIIQSELMKDELKLIVPGDHKWSARKLVPFEWLFDEPFIIRQRGSGTMKSIRESLSDKGYKSEQLRVVAEMGSTTAVIHGIKRKVGVSILSPIAVQEELKNGALAALSVSNLDLKRSLLLTTHNSRVLSPMGKSFVDYIKDKFALELSSD